MKIRKSILKLLRQKPYKFGWAVGFTKLNEMHNEWIKDMLRDGSDKTLQAHRGSYKTTCVSIALAILMITEPNTRIAFFRKTDTAVQEVVSQVKKILDHEVTRELIRGLWGVELIFTKDSARELSTNLTDDPRGSAQLVGAGTKSSVTGKHYDKIFTDDIVTLEDRVSRAERDSTKTFYYEMQNVKNPEGRIYNTGTPWHPDDCFSIMPAPILFDYHTTGLLSPEKVESLKAELLPSLFAANYELKHIASENVIFRDPKFGAPMHMVEQGWMHLDSAFWGEDYTAWSVMTRHEGKYYLYGKMKRDHVEDCYTEIMSDYRRFNCGKLFNETNADKGMVAKELRKLGIRVVTYHEDMNKCLKIVTHLKSIWGNLTFVEGTDPEYIQQICEYTEDAAHDDAPDSAACLARLYNQKPDSSYKPLWSM